MNPGGARGLVPRMASLALDNLRGVVILLVVAFHSVLAYLDFLPTTPSSFNDPPYFWRAFPIIDTDRWVGFDLFCAWQDVFLMSLFFFISGLFVWSSLERKGVRRFLHDRLMRLGLPFLLVVGFLMPLASYPTYLQTAPDPSLTAFWRQWLALPFWASGPMWFLWLLLVADFAAAGLWKFAPRCADALIAWSSSAAVSPMRYLAIVLVISALAYVPMALAFSPFEWAVVYGPFSFQLSRPLHYAVYFFAGAGIGASGIERGLFAADGPLLRRWTIWLVAAPASFLLWVWLTSLTLASPDGAPLGLQILDDLAFAVACFGSCFCSLALVLRFAGRSLWILDAVRTSAYGIYLVHYLFVVWLQYSLLPVELSAVVKAATVFSGTLLLSWSAVVMLRRLVSAAPMIGSAPSTRFRQTRGEPGRAQLAPTARSASPALGWPTRGAGKAAAARRRRYDGGGAFRLKPVGSAPPAGDRAGRCRQSCATQ